jgi:hypothetical protein
MRDCDGGVERARVMTASGAYGAHHNYCGLNTIVREIHDLI